MGGKLVIGPLGFEPFAGAVSGYSPHRLLFGRDPVGWGDCLPISLQDGAEDEGHFFGPMFDERAEVQKCLEDLHAKDFANLLAKDAEQSFKPGDRVWVRNRMLALPVHGKLERGWQGPCEVLRRISPDTYRVKKGRDLHFSAIEALCFSNERQESAFALLYGYGRAD